jgi:solute carrier family 4 anion exchanger 2
MRKPSIAFVRLRQSIVMLNQVQIPVPIRFLFVLLGPLSPGLDYHEVGRSMATLLANKRFRDIAYSATHRIDLIRAINEFFDDSIVSVASTSGTLRNLFRCYRLVIGIVIDY